MNNTFKLRSIVLSLLFIASTSISYSAEQQSNTGSFPPPHFHHEDDNDPIINDLLPYSNFLIGISQRLSSISLAPFLTYDNELLQTGKEILARFNNLIHKVELGINGNIDKHSLSIWICLQINGFNSVKENYHLSQEQGKVVNDILGICHDIWNELNNDDNNTQHSDIESESEQDNILE